MRTSSPRGSAAGASSRVDDRRAHALAGAAAASRRRSAATSDRQHRVGIVRAGSPTSARKVEHDRIELGAEIAQHARRIAAARTVERTSARSPRRTARTPDSAAHRRALRRSASARLRSSASTSRIWSSVPDASPTRTSATYIGGNSAGWRASASAKLSPARTRGAISGDHRPQPADVDVGRRAVRARRRCGRRPCSSSARSRVKTVTSSARGRLKKLKLSAASRAPPSSADGLDRNEAEILDAAARPRPASAPRSTRSPFRRSASARDSGNSASAHRTVVTRRTSAADGHPGAAFGDGVLDHRGHAGRASPR